MLYGKSNSPTKLWSTFTCGKVEFPLVEVVLIASEEQRGPRPQNQFYMVVYITLINWPYKRVFTGVKKNLRGYFTSCRTGFLGPTLYLFNKLMAQKLGT